MAAAIGLRSDYEAGDLRGLAKASRDARQTRRLLGLAVIYDGGSRTEAARVLPLPSRSCFEEELGMEIHVSTPEEKAAFKELTQGPVLEFIRSNVGDELVNGLLAEVKAAEAELYD